MKGTYFLGLKYGSPWRWEDIWAPSRAIRFGRAHRWAAVGLPSVTWARAVPSRRILSSRALDAVVGVLAATKRTHHRSTRRVFPGLLVQGSSFATRGLQRLRGLVGLGSGVSIGCRHIANSNQSYVDAYRATRRDRRHKDLFELLAEPRPAKSTRDEGNLIVLVLHLSSSGSGSRPRY
jgi:hypothetical protein